MRITVCAPDNMIRAFREIAKAKYGTKRGVYAKAFVEAISEYVERNAVRWLPPEFEFDPDDDNETDNDISKDDD